MLEANEETHQFMKPKNGNSHDELSVALKNQQKKLSDFLAQTKKIT